MHYTSYLEFRMWIFTYDPSGAHPIGRGYPLIIPHIIEVILVTLKVLSVFNDTGSYENPVLKFKIIFDKLIFFK